MHETKIDLEVVLSILDNFRIPKTATHGSEIEHIVQIQDVLSHGVVEDFVEDFVDDFLGEGGGGHGLLRGDWWEVEW